MNKDEQMHHLASVLMELRRALPELSVDSRVYLPIAQREALLAVGANPGSGMRQLADKLLMTPSAATQLVELLVAKGLVSNERNSQNKRKAEIHLTPNGRTMYRRSMRAQIERLKIFIEEKDPEYLNRCLQLLGELNEHLRRGESEVTNVPMEAYMPSGETKQITVD